MKDTYFYDGLGRHIRGYAEAIAAQLVKVLLCAFLAGPLSMSAWGICRPENSVGGSTVFSSDFASTQIAKPIETSAENGGCDYDFASCVHKYLYAEDNPVNMVDPSGNDDLTLGTVEFASTESIGLEEGTLPGVAAGEAAAMSGISQIGMSIAATLLLMQEIGLGPGDIINTMQTQVTQRANPTKSPHAYQKYQCDQFAQDAKTYFTENGQNPQIITYDSFPGKTYKDYITAVEGFGFFGGQTISENGHHEGVLVGGKVFDNNIPFGVPRNLWETGYEIMPIDHFGNYFNLRQAHELKYGILNPPPSD